jgi:farnesyl diphosphate synthase
MTPPKILKDNERAALLQLLQRYRERVNGALDGWLPPAHIQPTRLHSAMRYASLGSGKRVRASLVYATGEAVGAKLAALDGAACAVELIHAYSLIHDDLPAMDNDDLRRGEPTCHRAFDEATAILAGDALQSLCFFILAHDVAIETGLQQRLEMVATLALAGGSRGMAGGQAMDIAAQGKTLNLTEIENMHIHKTGALIRASVQLGALADPNVEKALLERLDRYAKCVGLAFQIQDDILDVEGDTATIGKPRGSDAAKGKPTYVALVGVAEARRMARDLHEQAAASLGDLPPAADPLRWMSAYIVERSS